MSTNQVINDVEPRTQFIATSLQTEFNAPWTADAASSVLVYARATGVAADDATQLVADSNYTVTFIGASETVRVTFAVGRTLDDVITLVRDTDSSRTNLYTNTNFTPSMLNQDFGTETLVQQQNQMLRSFAPHYDFSCTYTDNSDTDIDLVLPILSANEVWAMNSTGTAIVGYDLSATGGLVNTVTGTANEIDVDGSDATNPIVSLSSTIDAPGTFTIQGTVALDSVIDDDTMATASATNVATSESVKAYVDSVASPISWSEVTGTSQAMAVSSGYILNNASLVTATLPSTAAIGERIILQGKGAGLYKIAQNAGQTIHFGNQDTTTGTGGSLTATNQYDSIEVVCITANTDFAVLASIGSFTVV